MTLISVLLQQALKQLEADPSVGAHCLFTADNFDLIRSIESAGRQQLPVGYDIKMRVSRNGIEAVVRRV